MLELIVRIYVYNCNTFGTFLILLYFYYSVQETIIPIRNNQELFYYE